MTISAVKSIGGILWGWILHKMSALERILKHSAFAKELNMPETNTVYIIRMMKSAMMELIVEVLLLKR